MATKSQRRQINLRISVELDDRAKDFAKKIEVSKSRLIKDAIWSYILDKEKFACCPDCEEPLFDPEGIPITEGVQKITCSKGHSNVFDFESNNFLISVDA